MLCPTSLLTHTPLPPTSYTFQEVQEHTDQIWKFQRHDLIEEYHGRPPAPPPLILLSHLQLLIKRIVLKIPAKRHKQLSESPSPDTVPSWVWVSGVSVGFLSEPWAVSRHGNLSCCWVFPAAAAAMSQ